MRHIVIILLFLFIVVNANEAANSSIDTFLISSNLVSKKQAFYEIISNSQRYSGEIKNRLINYKLLKRSELHDLIYLSSYVRDCSFQSALVNIIKDTNYSFSDCIYSCAVIFSLAILSKYSNCSKLPPLDSSITPFSDLFQIQNRIDKLDLKNEKIGVKYRNEDTNNKVKLYFTYPESLLVTLADPAKHNYEDCFIAAHALKNTTKTSKYLKELYWLAIMNFENDASQEYLGSIEWAIFRAEKAKTLGK